MQAYKATHFKEEDNNYKQIFFIDKVRALK